MANPVLVSGIQPTGRLHIGNYLGALKNFVDLQNSGKYECYFFIADLHSLTEAFDPKEKSKQILELTADYIATGLDPKKSVIFLQSQIPAHSELAWILNTITPMGELGRMTQLKDKARLNTKENIYDNTLKSFIEKFGHSPEGEQEKEAVDAVVVARMSIDESFSPIFQANAGLVTYPVLMAADILLYHAKFVPVGDDQLQHLELTRTLARKFNKKFGKMFVEPQPILTKAPRVMSLKNPEKKMSKSDPASCLFLDDSPEEIKAKIKTAVTDSGSEIKYEPKSKAAVSNLLKIHSSLSGKSTEKLEKEFSGKTYSEFKSKLAEVIINHFAEYRTKKKNLLSKPKTLSVALRQGSERAGKVAARKISEVKKKIGILL